MKIEEKIIKEKRKLLITTDAFLPHWDGVARFLSEIIPRLKNDFEITVICPKFEGAPPRIPGVKIIRMPLLKIQFADTYPAKPIAKEIKREVKNCDLIFNQTIAPIGLAAIKYGKKYKKPIISYIHIIEWNLVKKSLKRFRWIAGWFAKILARKKYNKCNLLLVPAKEEAAILNSNKIKTLKAIVYLGTDINKFVPAEDKAQAKKLVGINPKYFVIGYLGRVSREKDILTLYRAFVKLQKENPNVRLLIVGGGIEEQERLFKAKQGIIFTGSEDNVVPYLQAMDVYVLPSLIETTSLTTMEAMSCGLPVLATKVGFVKEYIKHNVNGIFFPKRNSYILRKKIEMLMKDRELRETLGLNARETIEEVYSWDITVHKIKKILEGY